MAISLISSPEDFAPAYNKMVYVFDSTNKNNIGFKYNVELRLEDDTVVKSVRLNPRIDDGYGVFDVGKALQSYLTNERPDVLNGDASNCYVEYKVRVREEFTTTWDFDRWDLVDNRVVLTSSVEHPYTAGDSIYCSLDVAPTTGFEDNGIEGYNVVFNIVDDYTITLPSIVTPDDPGPGENFSGSTSFSNRADTPSGWTEYDDKVAFNAAWSFVDFPTFTTASITLEDSDEDKDILTNMPKTFTVTPTTKMVMNVQYTGAGDGDDVPDGIVFYRNDTTEFRTTTFSGENPIQAIGVGPENLPSSGWSGGSSSITDDATGYTFWIVNAGNGRLSNIYQLNIDRSCSRFNRKEIMFLDRKGSIGSYTFKYLSKERTKINRNSATFTEGNYVSPFYEGGKKSLSVSVEDSGELTTAWLTVAESVYFQELLSSPVAWLSEEDEALRAVLITNTSAETKLGYDEKNIRYTVTYTVSNNNIINW